MKSKSHLFEGPQGTEFLSADPIYPEGGWIQIYNRQDGSRCNLPLADLLAFIDFVRYVAFHQCVHAMEDKGS